MLNQNKKIWSEEILEGMSVALEFMIGGIEDQNWSAEQAIKNLSELINHPLVLPITKLLEPAIKRDKDGGKTSK